MRRGPRFGFLSGRGAATTTPLSLVVPPGYQGKLVRGLTGAVPGRIPRPRMTAASKEGRRCGRRAPRDNVNIPGSGFLIANYFSLFESLFGHLILDTSGRAKDPTSSAWLALRDSSGRAGSMSDIFFVIVLSRKGLNHR